MRIKKILVTSTFGLIIVVLLVLLPKRDSQKPLEIVDDANPSEGRRLSSRKPRNINRIVASTRERPPLPLEIEEWALSGRDLDSLQLLKQDLLDEEISRVIVKGYSHIDKDLTEDFREGIGISEGFDVVGFLKVQSILRPPTVDEQTRMKEKIDSVVASLKVDQETSDQIREFLVNRFSLNDNMYKIISTDSYQSGDRIVSTTTVSIGENFVEENNGEDRVIFYFPNEFNFEDTDTNPHTRVEQRYAHVHNGTAR